MTELEEIRNKIYDEADRVSRKWFVDQCQNTYSSMYCYYLPGEIRFFIGEEKPGNEWELAYNHRVSPGKTTDQVRNEIIGYARNLPILGN